MLIAANLWQQLEECLTLSDGERLLKEPSQTKLAKAREIAVELRGQVLSLEEKVTKQACHDQLHALELEEVCMRQKMENEAHDFAWNELHAKCRYLECQLATVRASVPQATIGDTPKSTPRGTAREDVYKLHILELENEERHLRRGLFGQEEAVRDIIKEQCAETLIANIMLARKKANFDDRSKLMEELLVNSQREVEQLKKENFELQRLHTLNFESESKPVTPTQLSPTNQAGRNKFVEIRRSQADLMLKQREVMNAETSARAVILEGNEATWDVFYTWSLQQVLGIAKSASRTATTANWQAATSGTMKNMFSTKSIRDEGDSTDSVPKIQVPNPVREQEVRDEVVATATAVAYATGAGSDADKHRIAELEKDLAYAWDQVEHFNDAMMHYERLYHRLWLNLIQGNTDQHGQVAPEMMPWFGVMEGVNKAIFQSELIHQEYTMRKLIGHERRGFMESAMEAMANTIPEAATQTSQKVCSEDEKKALMREHASEVDKLNRQVWELKVQLTTTVQREADSVASKDKGSGDTPLTPSDGDAVPAEGNAVPVEADAMTLDGHAMPLDANKDPSAGGAEFMPLYETDLGSETRREIEELRRELLEAKVQIASLKSQAARPPPDKAASEERVRNPPSSGLTEYVGTSVDAIDRTMARERARSGETMGSHASYRRPQVLADWDPDKEDLMEQLAASRGVIVETVGAYASLVERILHGASDSDGEAHVVHQYMTWIGDMHQQIMTFQIEAEEERGRAVIDAQCREVLVSMYSYHGQTSKLFQSTIQSHAMEVTRLTEFVFQPKESPKAKDVDPDTRSQSQMSQASLYSNASKSFPIFLRNGRNTDSLEVRNTDTNLQLRPDCWFSVTSGGSSARSLAKTKRPQVLADWDPEKEELMEQLALSRGVIVETVGAYTKILESIMQGADDAAEEASVMDEYMIWIGTMHNEVMIHQILTEEARSRDIIDTQCQETLIFMYLYHQQNRKAHESTVKDHAEEMFQLMETNHELQAQRTKYHYLYTQATSRALTNPILSKVRGKKEGKEEESMEEVTMGRQEEGKEEEGKEKDAKGEVQGAVTQDRNQESKEKSADLKAMGNIPLELEYDETHARQAMGNIPPADLLELEYDETHARQVIDAERSVVLGFFQILANNKSPDPTLDSAGLRSMLRIEDMAEFLASQFASIRRTSLPWDKEQSSAYIDTMTKEDLWQRVVDLEQELRQATNDVEDMQRIHRHIWRQILDGASNDGQTELDISSQFHDLIGVNVRVHMEDIIVQENNERRQVEMGAMWGAEVIAGLVQDHRFIKLCEKVDALTGRLGQETTRAAHLETELGDLKNEYLAVTVSLDSEKDMNKDLTLGLEATKDERERVKKEAEEAHGQAQKQAEAMRKEAEELKAKLAKEMDEHEADVDVLKVKIKDCQTKLEQTQTESKTAIEQLEEALLKVRMELHNRTVLPDIGSMTYDSPSSLTRQAMALKSPASDGQAETSLAMSPSSRSNISNFQPGQADAFEQFAQFQRFLQFQNQKSIPSADNSKLLDHFENVKVDDSSKELLLMTYKQLSASFEVIEKAHLTNMDKTRLEVGKLLWHFEGMVMHNFGLVLKCENNQPLAEGLKDKLGKPPADAMMGEEALARIATLAISDERKDEVSRAHKELASLLEQMRDEHEENLKTMRQEVAKLWWNLESLLEKNFDLNLQLESKPRILPMVDDKAEDVRLELKAVKAELEEAVTTAASLAIDKSKTEDQVKHVLARCSRLEQALETQAQRLLNEDGTLVDPKAIRTENERLQQRVEALKQELKSTIDQWTATKDDLLPKIRDLKQELRESHAQTQSLEGRLGKTLQEIGFLQKVQDDLNKNTFQDSDQEAEMIAKVHKLMERKQEARDTLVLGMQDTLKGLQSMQYRLDKNLDLSKHLKDSVDGQDAMSAAEVTIELRRLHILMEDREADIATLQSKLMDEEVDLSLKMEERFNAMQKTQNEMAVLICNLEKQKRQTQREIQGIVGAPKDRDDEREELMEENFAIQQELDTVRQELVDTRKEATINEVQAAEKIRALGLANDELNKKLTTASKDIFFQKQKLNKKADSLRELYEGLRTEATNLFPMMLQELQTKCTSIQSMTESVTTEMQSKDADFNQRVKDLEVREQRVQIEMTRDREALDKEIARVSQEKKVLESTTLDSKTQILDAEENKIQAQRMEGAVRREKVRLEIEVSRLNEKLKDLESKYDLDKRVWERELATLREGTATADNHSNLLRGQIGQQRDELAAQQAQLDSWEQKYYQEKASSDQAQKQLEVVTEQLNLAQTDLAASKANYQAKVNVLGPEVESLKVRLEKAEARGPPTDAEQRLEAEINRSVKFQTELSVITRKLEGLMSDKFQLEATIETKTSMHETLLADHLELNLKATELQDIAEEKAKVEAMVQEHEDKSMATESEIAFLKSQISRLEAEVKWRDIRLKKSGKDGNITDENLQDSLSAKDFHLSEKDEALKKLKEELETLTKDRSKAVRKVELKMVAIAELERKTRGLRLEADHARAKREEAKKEAEQLLETMTKMSLKHEKDIQESEDVIQSLQMQVDGLSLQLQALQTSPRTRRDTLPALSEGSMKRHGTLGPIMDDMDFQYEVPVKAKSAIEPPTTPKQIKPLGSLARPAYEPIGSTGFSPKMYSTPTPMSPLGAVKRPKSAGTIPSLPRQRIPSTHSLSSSLHQDPTNIP